MSGRRMMKEEEEEGEKEEESGYLIESLHELFIGLGDFRPCTL